MGMDNGKMNLISGKVFDFNLSPMAQDFHFDIVDIAHSLSMLCRYNGHCKKFYSVAEHSVLVSSRLPEKYRLWGLLHDAPEIIIGDVLRPYKQELYSVNEANLEKELTILVAKQFGLFPYHIPKEVKKADEWMMRAEMLHLFDHMNIQEREELEEDEEYFDDQHFFCFQPSRAREFFLDEYFQIMYGDKIFK